jgi:hypothetical protein
MTQRKSTPKVTNKAQGIEATLADRGSKYGNFRIHAQITQDLKLVMRSTPKWHDLTYAQRESLEMVAHKVGRILNGDPNYKDSWVDIEGYVHLVSQELTD